MLIRDCVNAKALTSEYQILAEEVTSQYYYIEQNIFRTEDSLFEYAQYFVDDESTNLVVTDRNTVVVTLNDNNTEIPISEILDKRRINLLEEARVYPSADSLEQLSIQRVVVEAGWGTNIESILRGMKSKGIKKFTGIRASCGASDILARYDLEDVEISTLGFITPKGDILEILYLGPYTTEPLTLNHVAKLIATQPNIDMVITDTDEYITNIC